MLKKMLLLTAATVAVYASGFEKELSERKVASGSVSVADAVDAQMQSFRTTVLGLVQGIQEEKNSLTARISHAQSEIQRLSAAAQNAQLEAQQVQEQLAQVGRDHQSALAAAKSSATQEAQEKVAQMQIKLENLQSEMDSIVQQRDAYSRQIELNKKELESSRKTLSENDLALASLKEQLATSRISNERLTAEKAEVASNLVALQSQLSLKQGELDSLSLSNTSLLQHIEKLRGELEAARNSDASSVAQIQVKEQEIAEMQRILTAADLQASQKQKEIEALRAERDNQLRDLTGQLEAVKGEHAALQGRVAPYNNFMTKYESAKRSKMPIERTPSGIFDDAAELPGVRSELAAVNERANQREIQFGEQMTAMSQEMGRLRKQLDGNEAALKELEDLRQAVSATAQAHQQAMDDLRAEYDARMALMAPAEDLDAAQSTIGSLEDQLKNMTSARNDLQAQVTKFTEMLKSMEEAAAGNESLLSQLRQQNDLLATQKAEVERKAAYDAQALKEADARRAQELEVKRAERAAASRAVGIRTKADVDAERESAARAAVARTAVAARIPTAVQLVPVWQFLRDIAVNTGVAPSLGLTADSAMNGMEGSTNRNKLLNQTLSVKGKSITINGVEPKDIWPAIRKLAADLGIQNYEQLGTEELVQAIRKTADINQK